MGSNQVCAPGHFPEWSALLGVPCSCGGHTSGSVLLGSPPQDHPGFLKYGAVTSLTVLMLIPTQLVLTQHHALTLAKAYALVLVQALMTELFQGCSENTQGMLF